MKSIPIKLLINLFLQTLNTKPKQENKRSMYIAVQKVRNKNNSVWSGLPAFVTAFGEFETTIAYIDIQR